MKNYDVYIFDYEGTLSENPPRKLSLGELLYSFNFKKLLPNKNIYEFVLKLKNKEIYVIGIVECNVEIEQKYEWLKKYYPMIKKQNCIFISGDHKKSEAIECIIKNNNYDVKTMVFIDDKQRHIDDVDEIGIDNILTKNISELDF